MSTPGDTNRALLEATLHDLYTVALAECLELRCPRVSPAVVATIKADEAAFAAQLAALPVEISDAVAAPLFCDMNRHFWVRMDPTLTVAFDTRERDMLREIVPYLPLPIPLLRRAVALLAVGEG